MSILLLIKPSSGGLLRADSLSMLLEVPEHLHIVFVEECGPWPGLTELSLLGPVVSAQHICHKTSDVSSVFFYYGRFSLNIV